MFIFIIAFTSKNKKYNTAPRLVAQRSWQGFHASASWVQASVLVIGLCLVQVIREVTKESNRLL
jgi:hypothetical protein